MFLKAGSSLRLHCVVSLGWRGPDQHFLDTAVLHWWVVSRGGNLISWNTNVRNMRILFVNSFIIVMLAVT